MPRELGHGYARNDNLGLARIIHRVFIDQPKGASPRLWSQCQPWANALRLMNNPDQASHRNYACQRGRYAIFVAYAPIVNQPFHKR